MHKPTSNQDFFDQCVAHLRKQGHACRDSDGDCVYRKKEEDGYGSISGCAIGGIMPKALLDEAEALDSNGVGASTLLRNCTGATIYFENVDVGLMVAMQEVHDDHSVDLWEEHFESTADLFKLTYTAP